MEQQHSNGRSEFFVDEVAPRPRGEPPSRTPAIVGFLIGGAIILVLGFVGSMFQNREPDDDSVPALRLLAPAVGDTVDNPVVLRFTTPADLRLERTGWGAGDLHLHAMADHREIMPGPRDITAHDGAFAWQLPPLQPGEHRIHLTWAGRNHANLQGVTDTVVVYVRR